MRLRSVELAIPDVAAASAFLEGVWGVLPAGSSGATRFWRGTGDHPYIVSLTEASAPAVTAITFSGEDIDRLGKPDRTFDVPGGGRGFEITGPEAQRYRFIAETSRPVSRADRDRPVQLTHAVLNSADVEACERFAVEKLGFKVSDRTGHMRFVRCNRKHHALAYAKSDLASLNHIAFEMRDMDAVMRGIGCATPVRCVWGPGRGREQRVRLFHRAVRRDRVHRRGERGRRRLQGRRAAGLEVAARAHRPLGHVEEGHGQDLGGRARVPLYWPLIPSVGRSFA
jgi:catechol 2,3-dioxygenase-like lactoylglutathione lyase family enzyme